MNWFPPGMSSPRQAGAYDIFCKGKEGKATEGKPCFRDARGARLSVAIRFEPWRCTARDGLRYFRPIGNACFAFCDFFTNCVVFQ